MEETKKLNKSLGNSTEVSSSSDQTFFLNNEVKKSSKTTIRERFDTLLQDHKKKWVEVYNKVGLSKSYASMIRNGHLIPPDWLRVKIAEALGCDSTCLWKALDIISTLKGDDKGDKNDN